MLTCLNLSHPPYGLACYVIFPLLSTARAHACLFSCFYNTRIAAQTGRGLKITPVTSRSSRCVCVFSQLPIETSLSVARTSYLCFVKDFGHVITLIRVALILVFTMSLRVCNLILAHM
jgi:hypothetical protein